MNYYLKAICLLLIIILLGILGGMDYQDAQTKDDHYCNMVAEGTWPDYKQIYEKKCDN